MAHQNRARKGTGRKPQARKTMQDDQARRKKELRDQLHGFSGAIGKLKVSGMLREGSDGSGRAEEMKMPQPTAVQFVGKDGGR